MPFIGNGRMLEDGSIFTAYQGVAWNQIQTYYFTDTQDGLYIKNVGQNDLEINGDVLKVGQFVNLINVSQFTAEAAGRESFEVQAWSGGPVSPAAGTVKTLYNTAAGKKWLDNVVENQRDGRATNIVCAIDSLTATESYLTEARDMLQGYMGDGGLGFVAFNNTMTTEEGVSFGAGAGSQQTNVQFAAGTDSIYNPSLYSLLFTAAVNSIMSFDDKLHEFDAATMIYLKKPSGGTVNFRDQLLPTTGNITIATANATKVMGFTTRQGWPVNTKSNKLQGVVNGDVQLMGVNLTRGTTGVRLHRVAQPGSKISQLALVDDTAYQDVLKNIGCDLYILLAGMNDTADTADVYDTNMRAVLDNVKAANPKAAILLLAMNETDTPSKNITLQTYIDKYQQLAVDYDCMIWDERLVLGSYAQALAAGWMKDGTHPNDAGNSLRAKAIVNFLGGTALSDIRKALTA